MLMISFSHNIVVRSTNVYDANVKTHTTHADTILYYLHDVLEPRNRNAKEKIPTRTVAKISSDEPNHNRRQHPVASNTKLTAV